MDPGNNPLAMNAFLEFNVGVADNNMRDRIQAAGYNNLVGLVRQDPLKHSHKVCAAVRKSTGGVAANKDVPITIEELLVGLNVLAKFLYFVQREMDYVWGDVDTLESLKYWYENLKENQKCTML